MALRALMQVLENSHGQLQLILLLILHLSPFLPRSLKLLISRACLRINLLMLLSYQVNELIFNKLFFHSEYWFNAQKWLKLFKNLCILCWFSSYVPIWIPHNSLSIPVS